MPSPIRSRSHSERLVAQVAGMCDAADLELEDVSSEARVFIRANAVTPEVIQALRAALASFRQSGRHHVRLGVSGGKLVPLPLV